MGRLLYSATRQQQLQPRHHSSNSPVGSTARHAETFAILRQWNAAVTFHMPHAPVVFHSHFVSMGDMTNPASSESAVEASSCVATLHTCCFCLVLVRTHCPSCSLLRNSRCTQPARRKRQATTPLVPEVAEIEGTLTAWKMPMEYALGRGEAIKGLYVLFHGCNHGPLDW